MAVVACVVLLACALYARRIGIRLKQREERFERAEQALQEQLREAMAQLERNASIDRQHIESERQLHDLVDSVTDHAIYLLDASGIVTTWNVGAQRIKGYTAEEIVGQHFSTFYTLEERERNLPAMVLEQAGRDGQYHAEGWRLRKDGSRFLAEVTVNAIRDPAGSLVGYSKVTADLTAKKEAEQARIEAERHLAYSTERERSSAALHHANSTLAAIVESSPLGIVTVNAAGLIESWNRAAEQIYGFTAAEMVGCPSNEAARKAVPGHDPDKVDIFRQWSGADTKRQLQTTHRRKDGTMVDISIASAPLLDQEGRYQGIVLIVEEITQRNALEAQLRHAQKMEAIGQLTGGIAHDFNNLLSIIICNLELLSEDMAPGSEVRLLADDAIDASLRGAELIRHLLAYSRKESLAPKLLQVNELIGNLARLLKRTLGEHIEIALNLEPKACSVMIDPVRFETALTNLATNARDAMPGGGKLIVSTSNVVLDDYTAQFADVPSGDYVVIAVTDSGSGMPPEVIARAFDPFFTTKRVGEGTGLGLSMVFGFVKQSLGHVRIYSEVGQGTTVKLYLPCCHSSCEEPDQAVRTVPANPRSATILVVEDNPALAKSVRDLLVDAKLSVIVAANGVEALAILRDRGIAIDLLFTDIVMPGGINGVELARQACLLRPELKVLFTSGFADLTASVSATAPRTEQILTKPYRKAELIRRILDSL